MFPPAGCEMSDGSPLELALHSPFPANPARWSNVLMFNAAAQRYCRWKLHPSRRRQHLPMSAAEFGAAHGRQLTAEKWQGSVGQALPPAQSFLV
jgi:hypothetical protein